MKEKKLLIISYYWPPAGGVVTYRLLKFIKYLQPLGWQITVYVPNNPRYENMDPSLEEQVPSGVTVIRHPIVEPLAWLSRLSQKGNANTTLSAQSKHAGWAARLALWIRGNLFIPDARRLWIGPSVRFLRKYLREHSVDILFSTAPPHTTTVIANRLKQYTQVPWVADFRDPWTQVDYLQWFPLTRWAWQKHRRLEQQALQQANLILNVSEAWKEDLERIGARTVEVIYSGYDPDDFAHLSRTAPEKFIITHAGLLGYDRLPQQLFAVLQKLLQEDAALADKLLLQLVGAVDEEVVRCAQSYGLGPYLTCPGVVSRQETLQLLIDSSVVLVLLNHAKNAKGRVPGKLFEGLASGNAILCLGPLDSDAATIVRRAGAGECIEYTEADRMEECLRRWYTLFINGQAAVAHPSEEYSAAYQTSRLDQLLREQLKGANKNR